MKNVMLTLALMLISSLAFASTNIENSSTSVAVDTEFATYQQNKVMVNSIKTKTLNEQKIKPTHSEITEVFIFDCTISTTVEIGGYTFNISATDTGCSGAAIQIRTAIIALTLYFKD